MVIEKVHNVHELGDNWDKLANSVYQKRSFLLHLEKTNNSNQRYYSLYDDGILCAGAAVYSLKINLLTFSNLELKLPMQVIGLPISNDESGLLGNDEYVNALLDMIFEKEKGIVLCLNYTQQISIQKTIEMISLPSMIFQIEHSDWDGYLHSLRHPYRRRILKALDKSKNVVHQNGTCKSFTPKHYEQYLEVVNRSKTKLEILNIEFFKQLPDIFNLNSFYYEEKLLYWNITLEEKECFYFLFGGLDYSIREDYDSYTNNLIEIIKDGINRKCLSINLGQTAEVSKVRFGANPKQKKMFLFHNSPIIRWFFRVFKKQLSYKPKNTKNRIYRNDCIKTEKSNQKKMHYAGIS